MYDEILHVIARGGIARGGPGVKSALAHGLMKDITTWKDTFRKYEVTPRGMTFYKEYREARASSEASDGPGTGVSGIHAVGISQFMAELDKK